MTTSREEHERFMQRALECAQESARNGEIPIGAIIVHNGVIIGEGANNREASKDPTAHAEVIAMRKAATHLNDWRLADSTMYVTVEPCPMCAGAAVMARIPRVVFGAWNDDYGAAGSRWDIMRDPRLPHRIEVISGVRQEECATLLSDFLAQRR